MTQSFIEEPKKINAKIVSKKKITRKMPEQSKEIDTLLENPYATQNAFNEPALLHVAETQTPSEVTST